MIVVGDKVHDVDGDLAAGRVLCPRCADALRPWGFARRRPVRGSPGTPPSWWRPRRASCRACSRTHVLVPAQLLPRRRDDVQAVGAALTAHAGGAGHRAIAVTLARPTSIVRNWLRAFGRNAAALAAVAARLCVRLGPTAAPIEPTGSVVADAVEALACAARAATVRLVPSGGPWAMLNSLTAGRLLAPSLART